MPSKALIFLLPLILIGLIPNLGLGIASFIVAGQNVDFEYNVVNGTCNGLIPLPTWLFVNAAVIMALCAAITIIVGIIIVAVFVTDEEGVIGTIAVISAFYFIMTLVYTCFLISWNVVGSISLFRDSIYCLRHGYSVAAMVLASLIFQWLSLITNWCSGGGKKNSDD